MKLRRGFIKEAEEYALEFREELGLDKYCPMPSLELAKHLEIPVFRISDLPNLAPNYAARVVGDSGSSFFGAVIPDGSFRAVVHNNFVSFKRQNADVMHELSHIILGHPVYPSIGKDGKRVYNSVHELEAKDLSYTLMIPKCIALKIVESEQHLHVASTEYQTSPDAIEYRIRKSDARRWAANRQLKQYA